MKTPEELARKAAEKTIQQYFIDSVTPDRNYELPISLILSAIQTALAQEREQSRGVLRRILIQSKLGCDAYCLNCGEVNELAYHELQRIKP